MHRGFDAADAKSEKFFPGFWQRGENGVRTRVLMKVVQGWKSSLGRNKNLLHCTRELHAPCKVSIYMFSRALFFPASKLKGPL